MQENTVVWLALPNLKFYMERFKTFIQVAAQACEGHVVIIDDNTFPNAMPVDDIPKNVTIHFIGGSKLNKIKYLWKLAGKALQANYETTIIHDTFWLKLGFFVYFRNLWKRRSVTYFLSLYSPNPDFYVKRRWREFSKENVSWQNNFQYISHFFQKVPLEFFSCRLANGIIGNDTEITAGVKKYYKTKSTLFALPTSVNPDKFSPINGHQNGIIPKDKAIHILGVGTLQIRKGWHILAEAIGLLRDKGVNVRVTLIFTLQEKDTNWFSDSLKKYNVQDLFTLFDFLPQEKLMAYYSNADVLVHPSFSEGSPRVVKEAMACECPVIASDLPGIRILDPAGKWIQRFQIGNAESLAGCLNDFGQNIEMWREKRPQIRQWVLNNFTPAIIAKQITECYKQTLSFNRG